MKALKERSRLFILLTGFFLFLHAVIASETSAKSSFYNLDNKNNSLIELVYETHENYDNELSEDLEESEASEYEKLFKSSSEYVSTSSNLLNPNSTKYIPPYPKEDTPPPRNV